MSEATKTDQRKTSQKKLTLLDQQAYYNERAFIGGCLSCALYGHEDTLAGVMSWFEAEWLTESQYAAAYRAIEVLAKEGAPIMPETIFRAINGSLTYSEIGELADDFALYWVHTQYYAKEVYAAWRRQNLGDELTGTGERLFTGEIDPDAAIDKVGELGGRYAPLMEDRALSNHQVIREIFEGAEQAEGTIPTGLCEIDNMLKGGLNPCHMVVIAGRTSTGKSSLATHIVAHAIFELGLRGCFVSLEMNNREVLNRMIAWHCHGSPSHSEPWCEGANAMLQNEANLQICAEHDIGKIETLIRNYVRLHNHQFAVIDYLQLVRSREYKRREEEVMDVSRRIKRLAQSCGIPIIALAQLNRQAADATPQIQHIRDSGAVEQDANVIMLIDASTLKESDLRSREVQLKIVVAKNRDGQTGVAEVTWNKPANRYRVIGQPDEAPIEARDNYVGEFVDYNNGEGDYGEF